MFTLHSRNIKTKLKLVIMLTSCLSLLFCCLGFITYEFVTMKQRLENTLINQAAIIGSNSTAAITFNDTQDAQHVLAALISQDAIMEGAIYDAKSKLFAKYVRPDIGSQVPVYPWQDGFHYSGNSLILDYPIKLENHRIGTLYLKSDLDAVYSRFLTYVIITIGFLLASALAAFVLASRFQKNISTPIEELATMAQAISKMKDYSIRAHTQGKGEFALLASAFNEMLGQIQRHESILKKANKSLQESEERYRTLFDLVPVAVYSCDATNVIQQYNQRAVELWGRDPLGRNAGELFSGSRTTPPANGHDMTHNDEAVAVAVAPHKTGVETIIERPDGSRRIVLAKSRTLKNAQADMVGSINCLFDITERKLAEEALQKAHDQLETRVQERTAELAQANSRFQAMFDQGLFAGIISMEGVLIDANASSLETGGFTRQEVLGKLYWETGWWNRSAEIQARLKAGFADAVQGHPFQCESVYFASDGSERVMDFAFIPIKDEDGRIILIMSKGLDITDRKRVEEERKVAEALRNSEAWFRHMTETAPVMIWMSGPDKLCTYFNKPWLEFRGRTMEQEMGNGWAEGVHPDDFERCLNVYRTSFDARKEFRLEYRLRRFDGEYRWLLDHGVPRFGSDNDFAGYIGSCDDITDRKQMEAELQKAYDKLEIRVQERTMELAEANKQLQKRDIQLSAAQQIANLGSWEWDFKTSTISMSDELHRIYGLRLKEFDGTPGSFFARVHPDDRSTAEKKLQEAIRTLKPFDFEVHIVRPDGVVRLLQSQGIIVPDDNGVAGRLIGVKIDVTEKRRAEQKFRDLLESAPDAMLIVNQEGRIVLVNAQTELVFGYSRSELLGRDVSILLPERLRSLYGWEGENSLFGRGLNTTEEMELYGLCKDETEFPFEVSISPLEAEDGLLISAAVRDITEQKKLRTRLLEAERTRTADMRRLAHSVQQAQEHERQRIARELHDGVCQRLSAMKLNAEVIEDQVRIRDKNIFRRFRSLTKQCEEMIGEIRRMSANLRPTLLDDFGLAIALGMLVREFKKLHDIEVTLDVDESAKVELDPESEIALYRIAQESLSNVGKYAEATRVTVSIRANDRLLVLRVSDNGKGFDMVEAAQRRNAEHGLGLLSMRERAELLGGTFNIESREGKGTTITVEIPMRDIEIQPVAESKAFVYS